MTEPKKIEYWPGTDTPKSTDNAFTLGYGNKPHGYEPRATPAPTPVPERRSARGFAKNGGTIESMADKYKARTSWSIKDRA